MDELKNSRRIFLKSGGGFAVGAVVVPIGGARAATPPSGAAATAATLPYPKQAIGKGTGMPVNGV